ncbi:two-component system response regulator YesN [Paenibacillus castaneae]|uniref:response regulator transcription factor n=1 Tax=Paenibacillus castaneae TaxID=474957 RepID=UPI000C9B4449|nr:response regulator [Paenibacillus castaneae]NIK77095.1 two-component system response regulator YesN [Paenibacillus castaneae]
MYNVLIVDDEPWVAYGIANLINWESLGFQIIGEVHDGLTALEIIIDKQPELIISDIRMPGLDGIQLLEKMKEKQLDSKVILISGYAEFEYAQKALRLGAYDYLLKQVDKNKLTETVLRLKDDLQNKQLAANEFEVMLDDLFEWLEPDNTITVGNYLSNKGIESEYPHFRFLCSLYSSPIAPLFKEGMIRTKGIDVIRLRTGLHKVSIILSYDESKSPLQFLNYITDYLSDAQHTGISSIGLFSTPIAKLYQESDIAMCSTAFHQGDKVMSYKLQELSPALRKKIIHLELSIKEQAREQIESMLDLICEYCKEQSLNIDQISMIYNQIVSAIYKYYGNSNRSLEIEHLHYEQIIRYFSTIEQLFHRLKSFFELLTEEEVQIHNVQVEKIIDYINSRYTEDILLSSIAKNFNMSIGYLSTLIKKETGATYSDYIMNKRLGMAKDLLNDPSLSVHDIVQRVGYKDYFHFNKLFKKHFGITPSKYRKL